MTSRWYAVQSIPQQESRAAGHLIQQGFEVFYPRCWRTVSTRNQYGRRTGSVLRPFFTGYLFVALGPDQAIYTVNKTIGVQRVVETMSGPLEIPLGVMTDLMARVDKDGMMSEPEAPAAPKLRVGEKRRITTGALEGLLAEIARVDDSANVRVFLEMFGSVREVTIPSEHLGKIA